MRSATHWKRTPARSSPRWGQGARIGARAAELVGLLLFLLQAQSSKAKIVGLANAGQDTTNSIKQAAEFGTVRQGQKLAGLLMTISEVHGFGLEAAQGLVLTEGFYWDHDDRSRAFSERFFKRTGRMPSMIMPALIRRR
jgi:ABC-type branched-subunit amino acid transport system substrate-binding protein